MVGSIVEAIKLQSISQPDKKCISDAKVCYTYSQYYQKIRQASAFLLDKGVKKGDKVIIKSAQNSAYLTVLHAVHILGAVAVPLEKTVKEERVCEINDVVKAVCFVSDKPAESVTTYLYSDIDEYEKEFEPENLPCGSDDSTILFTTGTTGKSKGILLSHSADVAVAENVTCGT